MAGNPIKGVNACFLGISLPYNTETISNDWCWQQKREDKYECVKTQEWGKHIHTTRRRKCRENIKKTSWTKKPQEDEEDRDLGSTCAKWNLHECTVNTHCCCSCMTDGEQVLNAVMWFTGWCAFPRRDCHDSLLYFKSSKSTHTHTPSGEESCKSVLLAGFYPRNASYESRAVQRAQSCAAEPSSPFNDSHAGAASLNSRKEASGCQVEVRTASCCAINDETWWKYTVCLTNVWTPSYPHITDSAAAKLVRWGNFRPVQTAFAITQKSRWCWNDLFFFLFFLSSQVHPVSSCLYTSDTGVL